MARRTTANTPSTTAIVAETFLLGIGGLGVALFLFFDALPMGPPEGFWILLPFLLVPALAIDYLLGNVIDRVADRFDDRQRRGFTALPPLSSLSPPGCHAG
jgi:hypothetical protein